MTSRPLRGLVYLILLIAAISAGWYLNRPAPLEVRLAAAETGVVENMVANTRAGTIKPCRRARLAPSVGGQIARLDVSEGQRVEAGKLLLELWNQDLVARVSLAEREAEASTSKAQASCLKSAQATREYQRLNKLHERNLVAEDLVDKAETESRALIADCAAAQASTKVQIARVELARANLAKTRLTAPFAGVVAEVTGELHEYVTPSPPGIPTPPAVDLIDDRCFYVSAPIDEVDASKVRLGQAVHVSLDAFGERRLAGTVRRIAPYVLDLEKQARTVEVEVELDDVKGELLAGFSADVEIIIERIGETLRIPTEAVMENDQVYVYRPDTGLLELRDIGTGLSNWDWTQVTQGLGAGDQVVISLSQDGLGDGVATVPAEATEAP